MTPDQLMGKIAEEADLQSEFYKKLNEVGEARNRTEYINMLIEHFSCNFDEANKIADFAFDGIFYGSDLTPQEIARNNRDLQKMLNKPHCPTCNSDNVKKISTVSKMTNTAIFGIFGTKRHRQFHCKNCGYEW